MLHVERLAPQAAAAAHPHCTAADPALHGPVEGLLRHALELLVQLCWGGDRQRYGSTARTKYYEWKKQLGFLLACFVAKNRKRVTFAGSGIKCIPHVALHSYLLTFCMIHRLTGPVCVSCTKLIYCCAADSSLGGSRPCLPFQCINLNSWATITTSSSRRSGACKHTQRRQQQRP